MGTSSLIDIIGSFFVAGILLLMGLQLNASSNEVRATYSGNYTLQTDLTTLIELLQADFRKIGYCRAWQKMTSPAVTIAEQHRIRYKADLNNNGNVDSVTYYTGSTSELTDTPNPYDFYLYRQVDTQTPIRYNLGLIQFDLAYRNATDDSLTFPISDTRTVYYMSISLAVSSPAPYKDEFTKDTSMYQVYWKQMRLVSKNLTNR